MPFTQLVVGQSRTMKIKPVDQEGNPQSLAASGSWLLGSRRIVSSISVANPTVVTTATAHGLVTGDRVIFDNTNSTPTINGVRTATVISATTFSVPVNVTVAGNTGVVNKYVVVLTVPGRTSPDSPLCGLLPVWPGTDSVVFDGGPVNGPAIQETQALTVLPASRIAFFLSPRTRGDAEITSLRIDESDANPQILAVVVTTTSVEDLAGVTGIAWLNVSGNTYIDIDNTMVTLGPQTVVLKSAGSEIITVNATNASGQAITGTLTVKTLAAVDATIVLLDEE